MSWVKELSNREWAVLLWTIVFILWMACIKNTRNSLASLCKTLIKTFTSKQVGPLFLVYIVFVFIAIIAYRYLKLWDTGLIKDTIIWFFGTAFILFINASDASKDDAFFQKILKKNLKFTILFVFIVNYFVFSFITELALVFSITLLVALSALADRKDEFKQIRYPLKFGIGLIALIMIVHSLAGLIDNYRQFGTTENLKDFILGPLLTFTIMPFIYLLSVYAVYDQIFLQTRLRMGDNKTLARYTKRKIFNACGLSLKKVRLFQKEYYLAVGQVKSKHQANKLVEQFMTK